MSASLITVMACSMRLSHFNLYFTAMGITIRQNTGFPMRKGIKYYTLKSSQPEVKYETRR